MEDPPYIWDFRISWFGLVVPFFFVFCLEPAFLDILPFHFAGCGLFSLGAFGERPCPFCRQVWHTAIARM